MSDIKSSIKSNQEQNKRLYQKAIELDAKFNALRVIYNEITKFPKVDDGDVRYVVTQDMLDKMDAIFLN